MGRGVFGPGPVNVVNGDAGDFRRAEDRHHAERDRENLIRRVWEKGWPLPCVDNYAL